LPTRDRLTLPPTSLMTTQFDGIYYGLSPEVGSECYPLGVDPRASVVDVPPSFLNRISNSAEWDGLEGRRERGDQVDTLYGCQVGSVVTRRQELPDQSGHEGRDQGDVRWLFESCEFLHSPPPSTMLITGVPVLCLWRASKRVFVGP
jgi:hypothetical protein